MAFGFGNSALMAVIGLDPEEFVKGSKQIQRESAEIERSTKRTERAAGSMGNALGAAFAGISFAAVVREVISIGARFEDLAVQLETVTGSAESAKAAFASIKDFAKTTPFEVDNITQAYVRLKAVGIEPTAARMMAFGDTAAAFGKDITEFAQAVVGASTGEMEMLKQFGIVARQQGDVVRFTFKGVTTEVGKNADEIVAFLERIGRTEFAGAMIRQSQTLNGLVSTLLKDTWKDFAATLYEGGLDQASKDAVKALIDLGNYLGTTTRELGGFGGAWATARAVVAEAVAGMIETWSRGVEVMVIKLGDFSRGFTELSRILEQPFVKGLAGNLFPGFNEGAKKAAELTLDLARSLKNTADDSKLLADGMREVAQEQFDKAIEASNKALATFAGESQKAKAGAEGLAGGVDKATKALTDFQAKIDRQRSINTIMAETGASAQIAAQAVDLMLSNGGTLSQERAVALARELDNVTARTDEIEALNASIADLEVQVNRLQREPVTIPVELEVPEGGVLLDDKDIERMGKDLEKRQSQAAAHAADQWAGVANTMVDAFAQGMQSIIGYGDDATSQIKRLALGLLEDFVREAIAAQARIRAADKAGGVGSGGGKGGGIDWQALGSQAGIAIASFVITEYFKFDARRSARQAQRTFDGEVTVGQGGFDFNRSRNVNESTAAAIASGVQSVIEAFELQTGAFAASLPNIALGISQSGDRFRVFVGNEAVRYFESLDEAIQYAVGAAFRQGDVQGLGQNVAAVIGAGLATEDSIRLAQELDSVSDGVVQGLSDVIDQMAAFRADQEQVNLLYEQAGVVLSDVIKWENQRIEQIVDSARQTLLSVAGIRTFGNSLKEALGVYEDATNAIENERRTRERRLAQAQEELASLRALAQAQEDAGVSADGAAGAQNDLVIASRAVAAVSDDLNKNLGEVGQSMRDNLEAAAELGGEEGLRDLSRELAIAEEKVKEFEESVRSMPEGISADEARLAVEGAFASLLRDLLEITNSEAARQELARITAEIEIASLRLRADELLALNRLTQAQVDLLNGLLDQAVANLSAGGGRRRGGGGRRRQQREEFERDRDAFREDLQRRQRDLLSDNLRTLADINDEYADLIANAERFNEGLEEANRLRDEAIRRFADERVRDPIRDFVGPGMMAGGRRDMSAEEREAARIREQFDAVREANEALLESEGELAEARWVVNAAEREALRQLAESVIDTFGLPMEQARDAAQRMRERLDFLNDMLEEGAIDAQRFGQVMGEVSEQAQLELFQIAAGLLDQMGNTEEAQELRRRIEEANFHIQIAQLNFLFEQYVALGLISGETEENMRRLLAFINDPENWPDFSDLVPAPPPGGVGGFGGGGFGGTSPAETDDQAAQRLLDQLRAATADALGPIESITTQMDMMRDEAMRLRHAFARMGVDFQDVIDQIDELERMRIAEVFDQAMDPLRELQDRLTFGSAEFSGLSLRQQFESNLTRAQALLAQASPDNANQEQRLAAIQELQGLLPNLLELGANVLDPGSQMQSFRDFILGSLQQITGYTPGLPGELPGTGTGGGGGPSTGLPGGPGTEPHNPLANLAFFPVSEAGTAGIRQDLQEIKRELQMRRLQAGTIAEDQTTALAIIADSTTETAEKVTREAAPKLRASARKGMF